MGEPIVAQTLTTHYPSLCVPIKKWNLYVCIKTKFLENATLCRLWKKQLKLTTLYRKDWVVRSSLGDLRFYSNGLGKCQEIKFSLFDTENIRFLWITYLRILLLLVFSELLIYEYCCYFSSINLLLCIVHFRFYVYFLFNIMVLLIFNFYQVYWMYPRM